METKNEVFASLSSCKITDESFSLENVKDYHLSLLLQPEGLSYAMLDMINNKYLAAEFISFEKTKHFNTAVKNIEEIFKNEQSLLYKLSSTKKIKSASLCIAHPSFTLIPSPLFEEGKESDYLKFNLLSEVGEKISYDILRNANARNIYVLPNSIRIIFRQYFPQLKIFHHTSVLIEGLLMQYKGSTSKKIFANFHQSYFEIVLLNGSELMFCNTFPYQNPEDVAYYLFFIFEQMKLNSDSTELVLSGHIDKISGIHSLLYNYIRNVRFASRPEGFNYSYKFDEISSHQFWSLFVQYLS
ncbi:MAG: DUF3822 family protein [Bacteroidota bacterium]